MRLVLAILMSTSAAHAQRPEYARIPPGAFGSARFEQPFWMGTTEVSVRQFAAFVRVTGHRTTAEASGAARTWRTPGYKLSGSQPVVYVSVRDAAAYCAWAGGRLPRDAEWEYAARAGSATRHFWGDALDGRYLWYRANTRGRPGPVGRKIPNPWGLYDVEGNVWEWTISEPVKGEPWANRRGGSWVDCDEIEAPRGRRNSPLIGLSIFFRIPVSLDHRYDDIGFRCLRDSRP